MNETKSSDMIGYDGELPITYQTSVVDKRMAGGSQGQVKDCKPMKEPSTKDMNKLV